ncbi:MAG TPA: hypothetical protein VLL08_01570 [Kineosporiaceae bacterium]|nr:hypothetical protein [Kineosporiaceae bacterium]
MLLMAPFLDLESFGLRYLVLEDDGAPSWVPAPLFEVSDSRLSAYWQFKRFPPQGRSRFRALWGYDSMINDPNHHDSLMEVEKSAHRVFLAEIDRSCLAGRDEEHLLALERSLNR